MYPNHLSGYFTQPVSSQSHTYPPAAWNPSRRGHHAHFPGSRSSVLTVHKNHRPRRLCSEAGTNWAAHSALARKRQASVISMLFLGFCFGFERDLSPSHFSTEELVSSYPPQLAFFSPSKAKEAVLSWEERELFGRESLALCGKWEFLFCLQVPGPPQVRFLVETKAVHVSLFQGRFTSCPLWGFPYGALLQYWFHLSILWSLCVCEAGSAWPVEWYLQPSQQQIFEKSSSSSTWSPASVWAIVCTTTLLCGWFVRTLKGEIEISIIGNWSHW